MSNVVPLFTGEALSPEQLHALGSSYDQAANFLSSTGSLSAGQREALAFALLGWARSGITDIDILTLKAVSAFGRKREATPDFLHATER